MKLGLIGYGAIGKHIEGAGLENIELVSVLVKRPRPDQRQGGKLTHEPDRFFAQKFDAVAECAELGGARERQVGDPAGRQALQPLDELR